MAANSHGKPLVTSAVESDGFSKS